MGTIHTNETSPLIDNGVDWGDPLQVSRLSHLASGAITFAQCEAAEQLPSSEQQAYIHNIIETAARERLQSDQSTQPVAS